MSRRHTAWLAPASVLLVAAQPAPKPDALDKAIAGWVAAFNALDLPAFLAAFDREATVFHPAPVDGSGKRVEPDQLERTWGETFASLKARSKRQGPPWLDIAPRDLRVDRIGRDAAVVSFHLSNDAFPGRRTTVWHRTARGWRIVHLHASRLPPGP